MFKQRKHTIEKKTTDDQLKPVYSIVVVAQNNNNTEAAASLKTPSPSLTNNNKNKQNNELLHLTEKERIEIERLKTKLNQFSLQLATSTAHLIVNSQKEFLSLPSIIIASKEYLNLTSKKISNIDDAMLF